MSKYAIDIKSNKSQLEALIKEAAFLNEPSHDTIYKLFKKHTDINGQMFSKSTVIVAYRKLKKNNPNLLNTTDEKQFFENMKMKKTRTISGVTPVTVLTKPFPCPGKCIFCPNDVRMPKSYLSDEPGAQRAGTNRFDPYLQTYNRLVAFRNTGHPTDKVELLILGGTWSSYPESYQIWFVKRCFDAMNDFGDEIVTEMISPSVVNVPFEEEKLEEIKGDNIQRTYNQIVTKASIEKRKIMNEQASWEELYAAHKKNETAKSKCVGLVIETRPDEINEDEVIRIRKLGATKVQIGIQSLNNKVLKMNKRGHDVKKTEEAFLLLRAAGFKILAHWMPNLYGSSPAEDIKDYKRLFRNKAIRPDELKIYPCSLIESAELMKYYKKGLWRPYTEDELLEVTVGVLPMTPRYCRLTRVIRDIPSTDIVAGNKKTNFRQIAENEVKKQGYILNDIRSREIKSKRPKLNELKPKTTAYETNGSTELFMEYVTKNDEIAAFLRLSFPKRKSFIDELEKMPIIREIHVYGSSAEIGESGPNITQHMGLGKLLIKNAKKVCFEKGYTSIAVISSIGTRKYYEKHGFVQKNMYQICDVLA